MDPRRFCRRQEGDRAASTEGRPTISSLGLCSTAMEAAGHPPVPVHVHFGSKALAQAWVQWLTGSHLCLHLHTGLHLCIQPLLVWS